MRVEAAVDLRIRRAPVGHVLDAHAVAGCLADAPGPRVPRYAFMQGERESITAALAAHRPDEPDTPVFAPRPPG